MDMYSSALPIESSSPSLSGMPNIDRFDDAVTPHDLPIESSSPSLSGIPNIERFDDAVTPHDRASNNGRSPGPMARTGGQEHLFFNSPNVLAQQPEDEQDDLQPQSPHPRHGREYHPHLNGKSYIRNMIQI
jgi:hypothetical protein